MRGFDPRICPICIDANAVDRAGGREALVDRLLELRDADEINLIVPKGVRVEVLNPRTPRDVQNELLPQIFSISVGLNSAEKQRKLRLITLLQGNATSSKHAADADHVFEAGKYGGYS